MNEQVWSIDGVKLPGRNWYTVGNNCLSATLSTLDSAETSLGLNLGLQGETHGMFQLVWW